MDIGECNFMFEDVALTEAISCLEVRGRRQGRQQKICFVALLEEPHEGSLSYFSRLTIRCSDILHCGIYRAMPE